MIAVNKTVWRELNAHPLSSTTSMLAALTAVTVIDAGKKAWSGYKGAKAAVAAMGGAAVFTGLALAASKARASSSFSDGGVAGLDDVVAEPVAE